MPVQSGGIASLTPSDAVRVLWAFATLGGPTPHKLLSSIHPHWHWRVLPRSATAATPSSPTSANDSAAVASVQGEEGDWDPLGSDPVPRLPLLSICGTSSSKAQDGVAHTARALHSSTSHSSSSSDTSRNSTGREWGQAQERTSKSKGSSTTTLPQGGLSSFTTSQLAGCCWALAVMPGGLDTPAFVSAWMHLIGQLESTVGATGTGIEGCSDAVLSQIWQVGVCSLLLCAVLRCVL